MRELDRTSKAIRALRTSEEHSFGMHSSGHVVVGGRGITVGEVRLDPARHPMTAVRRASPLGRLTGWPHVGLQLPDHPIQMNVIIHDDSGNRDQPQWLDAIPEYKSRIAAGIKEAIVAAKRMGDTSKIYLLGNPKDRDKYGQGTRFVERTEKPLSAAQKIADLCRPAALTVLVGELTNLPFLDINQGNLATTRSMFRRTIAVKTNHPVELQLPRGRGIYPMGNGEEIDSSSHTRRGKAKFETVNKDLAAVHFNTITALGEAGIVFAATSTFETNYSLEIEDPTLVLVPPNGSMQPLDRPIASAIETVRRR